MLNIITGTTTTNPNDNKTDRFIKVKLHNTDQEIKAVPSFSLEIDQREQLSNIKVGTEVLMLVDDINNFYIIGSLNQGISLVDKQIYKIENKEQVSLLTDDMLLMSGVSGDIVKAIINVKDYELNNADKVVLNTKKFKVKNDSGEFVQILSDLADLCSKQVIIGNLGVNATNDPATMSGFADIKSRLDTFKL